MTTGVGYCTYTFNCISRQIGIVNDIGKAKQPCFCMSDREKQHTSGNPNFNYQQFNHQTCNLWQIKTHAPLFWVLLPWSPVEGTCSPVGEAWGSVRETCMGQLGRAQSPVKGDWSSVEGACSLAEGGPCPVDAAWSQLACAWSLNTNLHSEIKGIYFERLAEFIFI